MRAAQEEVDRILDLAFAALEAKHRGVYYDTRLGTCHTCGHDGEVLRVIVGTALNNARDWQGRRVCCPFHHEGGEEGDSCGGNKPRPKEFTAQQWASYTSNPKKED